jgi:hypothetical protein
MRRIAIGFVVWMILFLWAVVGAFSQEVEKDASGFVDQLNNARAARGLGPVVHDVSLVTRAQANNALQRLRGLGHWHTGGVAQCAAIGFRDIASTLSAWTHSPGHAAIIFSPYAQRVGYAGDGWAATVSVAMGAPATLGASPALAGDQNGTGRQPAAQNNKNRLHQTTLAQPTAGTTAETCAGGCYPTCRVPAGQYPHGAAHRFGTGPRQCGFTPTTPTPSYQSLTRQRRGRRCGFRLLRWCR